MNELLTQSNIMFVFGLIGIAYTVFMGIYKPQHDSMTNDMLMDQRANFLRDEYEGRFKDIYLKFDELAKTNNNHLHTLESKLDSLTALAIQQGKDLVRIETTMNIKK